MGGERSAKANFSLVDDTWLRISSDDESYGNQLTSELIRVEPFNDYVLRMPLKLEQGRVSVRRYIRRWAGRTWFAGG